MNLEFYNILETCRHYNIEHLVYASSSSVYASNKMVPYSTDDKVDNPVTLYVATKKSNELMAHAYSKLYNIGNSNPENLLDFVQILSEELVRAGVLPEDYDFEAHKELVTMQPGDVPVTYADTSALERDFGFKPHTPLREGLRKFAEWYKEFYMKED